MAECNPVHQMVKEIGGLIVRISTQSGGQIWKLSLGRIFRIGEGPKASTTFDKVELYGTLRLVQHAQLGTRNISRERSKTFRFAKAHGMQKVRPYCSPSYSSSTALKNCDIYGDTK